MAASGGPVMNLCEEATCCICLDYFQDPVIIPECGHNFCRACLTQYWRKSEREASCPQCRKTVERCSIRQNQQLANVVEITKKFNLLGGIKEAEGKGRVCEKHKEPLKLFCKEDEAPICLVCDRSKEHKSHKVVPIEEASPEYKDQLSSCLDNMRKARKKIMVFQADAEMESQDLLKQMEAEREKMVAEIRQMHQFLEEKEKLLLAQMAEVEKEIAKKREEHLARLSLKLSSLDSLIREMEEKLREPASEFLQDIRSILQRSQAKENLVLEDPPVAFPPALKWRIWDFCDFHPFLEGVMKQFRDTVEYGVHLRKEKVTLDPDTANPYLILSEDRKRVIRGKVYQDLPNNPERFDMRGYVLGCEGFTSGRHFWEVTVGREETWELEVARNSVKRKCLFSFAPRERSRVKECQEMANNPERFDCNTFLEVFEGDRYFCEVFLMSEGEWAMGVARKSVKRKGKFTPGPKEGIWRIGNWGDQYRVSNLDGPPVSMLGEEPKRIRVALNCEGGQVSFYNADTAALLHSFSEASFSGETLQPFFYMFAEGHLTVS